MAMLTGLTKHRWSPSQPATHPRRPHLHKKNLHVDESVAITVSSRKTSKQRRLDELLHTLSELDTLIVTELSHLGRSVAHPFFIPKDQPADVVLGRPLRVWAC